MSRPPAGGARPTRRLVWFAGFYGASVLTFAALVYLLRAIVRG